MMEDKLVRMESNSGAVINTDNEALAAYKKRKHMQRKQQEEIDSMKRDITDIKSMLEQLLINSRKYG